MSLTDPDEAAGMYRESLSLVRQRAVPGRAWDNWTAMIFWRLSDLEFRRAHHDGAIEAAAEGHKVFPRHPDFLLQTARSHFESGRAAEAVRDLQLCLSSSTRNPPLYQDARILGVEARLMLGLSLIALDRLGEAERPLREAVSMAAPANSVARKALGSLLLRTRRPREALAQFEEACRLDPADEAGRAKRAEALAALGQWGAALATLSALRSTPDAPERIRQVVDALLSRESTERAVHILSDWYDADTTQADANYWLGFAALQLGDLASARALWTQAVVSRPGFMLAEEGLKLLPA
jgi:tetratricopeptide (TPR) repeat protein